MTAAEKSVDIIKRVVKDGPIALWEIIMEKAEEIKTKVMEGIRNWAITQIIKKMSVKLLSMLNPAGAIVQAILLLYDVVMFFVDNWDRIIDFVKSVFDSIGAIASGAIGQAAGFIEKTLGKTIPMILSFAARFVGLSGIGKAIRKVIETIQKPFKKILDKMIKFLVKQVKKLFKSGKSKVKGAIAKVIKWWKLLKKFIGADGKKHKIYFEGEGNSAKVMVRSELKTLEQFLSSVEVTAGNKDMQDAKVLAIRLSRDINTTRNKRTGASTKAQTNKNKEDKKKALDTLFTQISIPVAKLFGTSEDLPDSEIEFATTQKGNVTMGSKMTAKILSSKGKGGSAPKETNKVWEVLKKRKDGGRTYYVRGHLLNDNIHGPGTWKNMTPLSQTGNKKHLQSIETLLKDLVHGGTVIRYVVEPVYNRSVAVPNTQEMNSAGIDPGLHGDIKSIRKAENHVPSELQVSADVLAKKGGGYEIKRKIRSKSSIENEVNSTLSEYHIGDAPPRENVSLTNDSAEKIAANTGINLDNVVEVQAFAKEIPNLSRYSQLLDEISKSLFGAGIKLQLQLCVEEMQALRNVRLN